MEISRLEQLRSTSSLARAIFQADVPEEVVRQLPAQSLYHVIKHNGIESSLELLEATTADQFRLLLDFDLWDGASLNEERLWDWLELTTENDELKILQRVISSLDLKIIGRLINQYVEVQTNEEGTDLPPGPLFFTPDKGFTWIRVICEDQRQHFLLSKVLAFLFETNADVFYQLLATKAVTTPSLLEEEAWNDRTKRLSGEGLPDLELAAELTTFLSVKDGLDAIAERGATSRVRDVVIVEPLAKLSEDIEPLTSALKGQAEKEAIASELTLLVNACLVRFQVPIGDVEEVSHCARQVQGALNIGLGLLCERSEIAPEEIIRASGLQIIFRIGLTQILDVSKAARKYERELQSLKLEIATSTQALLECLARPFPCLPAGYGVAEDALSLEPTPEAITSEGVVRSLREQLKTSIN